MIRHLIAMVNPRYAFRSSVDGRYVTRVYALAHPATTYGTRLKARLR